MQTLEYIQAQRDIEECEAIKAKALAKFDADMTGFPHGSEERQEIRDALEESLDDMAASIVQSANRIIEQYHRADRLAMISEHNTYYGNAA